MFAKFLVAFAALAAFVSAQIPVFPDNIIAFPERDFVTVEGFNGLGGTPTFAGKMLALHVYRSVAGTSTLVGEALGTVSGTDIAFEVNHPGGYCWGDGSTIKVTPDIQSGDSLVLHNPSNNQVVAQTIVQNGIITGKTIDRNIITITGTVSGLTDPTAIEARIVAPALTETAVARRDVRAVPGGIATNPSYNSNLVINGNTWTATMTFVNGNGGEDSVTAGIAFAGAFSVSTWQVTDANGNAQGLTISEFGEAGGPMTANSPPYAGSLLPILPDGVAVYGNNIYWNPATDQPGTAFPFNSYTVEVLRPTTTTGVTSIVGASRLTKAAVATTRVATLSSGFNAGDVIEVRAGQIYSGVDQFTVARKKTFASQIVILPVAPTFSGVSILGNAARTVTIQSSQGLQIAYTITTGSIATPVSLGSPSTLIYTGQAIAITGTQTIQAIAFGTSGLISSAATITVTNAYPGTVTTISATPVAVNSVNYIRVTWTPLTTAPTNYRITATAGITSTVVATVAGSVSTVDIGSPKLSNNVAYTFTVTTFNLVGGITYDGSASPSSNAVVFTTTDVMTVTDARYRANTELRVTGTGSVDGAIITVYSGPDRTGAVLGSVAVSFNAFSYRSRTPPAGLTTISLGSSMGATVNIPV